jgi:hypothetical protein
LAPKDLWAEEDMKNRLCSFLSRLALPLLLLSPAITLADTITTFDVSGTATNLSGGTLDSCAAGATCDFSGMFQVDVTTGAVESSGLDITLPGLPAFDMLGSSIRLPNSLLWQIGAFNSLSDTVDLDFTTAPTPGSLVGFDGGVIFGAGDIANFYRITGGTITPVPEPSSLVPLAGGLGSLVFGFIRRRFAGCGDATLHH